MENNVFLARLVTFDFQSLLFKINELESYIDTEQYRLVSIYGNRAYDLQSLKIYKVLNKKNGIIVNEELGKIKPDVQYVFDIVPFIDYFDVIKIVYGINKSYEEFISEHKDNIEQLNEIMSSDNKVIDFKLVKKLTNKRKL